MNYRIRMRNLREDRDLTQREVAQVIINHSRDTAILRTVGQS